MEERRRKLMVLAAAGVGGLTAMRFVMQRWRAYDLRGKTVLITGGSRGLGLVMAREFARSGARLALCARRDEELRRARASLESDGAEVMTASCDMGNPEQVEAMVAAVIERYGRIDVLVNNAGIIQVGPMETMTLGDYEEAMRVHFWGPLYATLAVLPGMRERREGRIVNISSIGGKISVPHLLPYSASKFALTGFSEGLRAEAAKDGIAVTTVCPGLMRTGSPPNATFKGRHRAEYAWFSISDSLPFITISAESAARQIVSACKRGDAELVLTFPAEAAAAFHGLFPGLTADLLGWVNAMLPRPGGIGEDGAPGRESASSLSPSWLTGLTDKAARHNNEIP